MVAERDSEETTETTTTVEAGAAAAEPTSAAEPYQGWENFKNESKLDAADALTKWVLQADTILAKMITRDELSAQMRMLETDIKLTGTDVKEEVTGVKDIIDEKMSAAGNVKDVIAKVEKRMKEAEDERKKMERSMKEMKDEMRLAAPRDGWQQEEKKERGEEEGGGDARQQEEDEGGTRDNENGGNYLNHKAADKFWPERWRGEKGCRTFKELTRDLELYVTALAPGVKAKKLLEMLAEQRDEGDNTAIAMEVGTDQTTLKKISCSLGPLLHKTCQGEAGTRIEKVEMHDGFGTYRQLAKWFAAQSASDGCNLLAKIMKPSKATNLADLDHKLTQWDGWVREYVSKFKGEGLSDKIKETAIRMMTPQGITDNRISGVREMNSYRAIRIMLDDLLQDKRENGGANGG